MIAGIQELDRDRLLNAGRDFLKRQPERDADVRARARLRCTRAATEQIVEAAHPAQIAHEDVERFREIDVMETAASSAPQSRFAVSIVSRALVAVPQHVVRFRDLLEPLLGFLRAVVAVRMVRHRKLAIRLLYLVIRGRARDLEYCVIISHLS